MAKMSYIINSNSNGSGKHNFHFDGNCGSGKLFSNIFKKGKEVQSSEPNEIADLISKAVLEGEHSKNKITETRIEFEGDVDEIKEIGIWTINQIKAEIGTLNVARAFFRDLFGDAKDFIKEMFQLGRDINKTEDELRQAKSDITILRKENENLKAAAKKTTSKKAGFDPDAKVEKQ